MLTEVFRLDGTAGGDDTPEAEGHLLDGCHSVDLRQSLQDREQLQHGKVVIRGELEQEAQKISGRRQEVEHLSGVKGTCGSDSREASKPIPMLRVSLSITFTRPGSEA